MNFQWFRCVEAQCNACARSVRAFPCGCVTGAGSYAGRGPTGLLAQQPPIDGSRHTF